jgi:signal transduction histidine kinase
VDGRQPRFPAAPINLSRLKWAFLATLVILFVFVEFARYNLMPFLDSWQGRLLMDLVILLASLFFFALIFVLLSRMHDRVERQNRELLALHRAGLDLSGDLSLNTLLQKVVEQATQLLEARYGAVAVIDGQGQIQQFLAAGVTAEQQRSIGAPPSGLGLLGISLHEGRRLRLDDIEADPRSAGMPPNHPPMRSLLAVPIVCKGPFRGNLYLTEKTTGPRFTQEDEETLERFATAAATAIDNAHLHEQLRSLAIAEERVRIAREMHDGMAQILAYVNAKAQAVQAHLARDRHEEAARQLDQLADAARDVYTDAREGIQALRTELGPGLSFRQALEEYITRWQSQSGITSRVRIEGELQLPATVELQLLRIVQEALSNARKHSGAQTVDVALVQHDSRIVAEVADDGAGFDPRGRKRSEFPRFGLAIMRERAESIDGQLEVTSEPGNGTQVRIEIPLKS